jgi:hypothetical protein
LICINVIHETTAHHVRMDDRDFFLEKAEWWREYAKLAGSEAERSARQQLSNYFARTAAKLSAQETREDPAADIFSTDGGKRG